MNNRKDVEKYIDDVISGRRITGIPERNAVDRYVRDTETASGRGLRFDEKLANNAINFFAILNHTDGHYAGRPFILSNFQKFITWNLFGWVHAETGHRRFRDSFLSFARGQGKTFYSAGLCIKGFAHDNEPRAEVYTAATARKQAYRCFDDGVQLVRNCRSNRLKSKIKILTQNMHIMEDGSKFEPLGSDYGTADGLKPHFLVIDELHAWHEGKHREFYEKLVSAFGKRLQSMSVTITTAGNENSTLWKEQYEYSKQVASGVVEDDRHFSFITEADEDDDVHSETAWLKANPMLQEPKEQYGQMQDELRSIIESESNKAKVVRTKLSEFIRYRCNRYSTSEYKLIDIRDWRECEGETLIEDGDTCYAGFDWGWHDDLAALTAIFPRDDGEKTVYSVLCRAWVPEDTHHDLRQPPWCYFIENGELIVTPGNTTDTAAVYDFVNELNETYYVRSMAYDPNNAREFAAYCESVGIESNAFQQGYKRYHAPTNELCKLIQERRFIHSGERLLEWCADNVTAKELNSYVMPVKPERNSARKVDPIQALIMALGEEMDFRSEGGRCVFMVLD